MKRFPLCLVLVAIGALLIGSAPLTAGSSSPSPGVAVDDNLPPAAYRELAAARLATAKYQDVAQAEADGYVFMGYEPGEGFAYFNEGLYDCTFDAEHPEALLYVEQGNHLRLAAVEYFVPEGCSDPETAPEGFSGDADVWVFGAEGFPEHALRVWLWLGNPNGIFAPPPHPRIP